MREMRPVLSRVLGWDITLRAVPRSKVMGRARVPREPVATVGKGKESSVGKARPEGKHLEERSETRLDGQPLLIASLESDSILVNNIKELETSIGKKLFAAKDVYYNGQIKASMTEEQFLAAGTSIVRSDRLTSEPCLFLKTRTWSKLYAMAPKEGQPGKYRRSKITRNYYNTRNYSTFKGVASCSIGVHTSMNKGSPKWGIYLSVVESYLVPVENERAAEAKPLGCVLGESVEFSDAEDEEEEEAAEQPSLKRKKTMEPTGSNKKPLFTPSKKL